MTPISEMTNSDLRVALLEALAVRTDQSQSLPVRDRAGRRYRAVKAEIEAREGDRVPARTRRLLRGF